MSKFKFRLEKILELREYQQKQAEIELGKAVSAEAEIETKIKETAEQHASVVQSINESKDITALSTAQQFFTMLDIQKEYLLEELTKAQLVTEKKRKIMQETMQNCSALSKMKQKENEQFLRTELQKSEDMVDDIISARGNNFGSGK